MRGEDVMCGWHAPSVFVRLYRTLDAAPQKGPGIVTAGSGASGTEGCMLSDRYSPCMELADKDGAGCDAGTRSIRMPLRVDVYVRYSSTVEMAWKRGDGLPRSDASPLTACDDRLSQPSSAPSTTDRQTGRRQLNALNALNARNALNAHHPWRLPAVVRRRWHAYRRAVAMARRPGCCFVGVSH